MRDRRGSGLREGHLYQLAYAEAVDYYREAVALLESVTTANQETFALYLLAWGGASYEAGDYHTAEPLYR